jgi:hypothetical protein
VLFEVTMAALIGDALLPGSLRQAVLHGTKERGGREQGRCPWQTQRTCSSRARRCAIDDDATQKVEMRKCALVGFASVPS